ncbi:hypothetical protein D3C80_1101860 [compost metagenome]
MDMQARALPRQRRELHSRGHSALKLLEKIHQEYPLALQEHQRLQPALDLLLLNFVLRHLCQLAIEAVDSLLDRGVFDDVALLHLAPQIIRQHGNK